MSVNLKLELSQSITAIDPALGVKRFLAKKTSYCRKAFDGVSCSSSSVSTVHSYFNLILPVTNARERTFMQNSYREDK